MTARAYLGLGGNMGDSRAMVAQAVAGLAAEPGVKVAARSRDYLTPPWGDEAQPAFVNGCVAVDTTLSPEELLGACLAIERRLGRDRTDPEARRWGPRLIDIDVLIYEGCEHVTEALVLPHPRLAQRAFALVPLAEIAPDAVVTAAGSDTLTARQALARVDASAVTPLD